MHPLPQVPDWNGARTAAALEAALPGVEVQWLREIGSTSGELKRQIAAGLTSSKLLYTDHQTEGRGRLGRHWLQAGRGRDLALSLALPQPAWTVAEPRLSLLCGVTVAQAVDAIAGTSVGLKWPNDLELKLEGDWKKVGGILIESTPVPSGAVWLLIGLGLNVNSAAADFPPATREYLCTLSDVVGPLDLGQVHVAVALALYGLLYQGPSDAAQLMHEWSRRDTTGRCRYLLRQEGGIIEVLAIGVDEATGALRCVDQRGNLTLVTSHSALERLP